MSSAVAFPYPVLGRSDDYIGAEFQVALREPEVVDVGSSSVIKVSHMFDLSDDALNSLIDQKKAKLGFEIICKSTALRYVDLVSKEGSIEIPQEQVHGRVELFPCLFATQKIERFKSENFNEEFSGASFTIHPGDILAQADADAINVNFGTLTFESLLSVVKASHLEAYSYDFSLDGNTIQIAMGEALYLAWGNVREKPEIRPYLVMSIYKDCIVSALETLIKEKHHERSWANSLLRMLEKRGIEIPESSDFSKLNLLAQKILQDRGVKRIAHD